MYGPPSSRVAARDFLSVLYGVAIAGRSSREWKGKEFVLGLLHETSRKFRAPPLNESTSERKRDSESVRGVLRNPVSMFNIEVS
jgi:hypothetical protein